MPVPEEINTQPANEVETVPAVPVEQAKSAEKTKANEAVENIKNERTESSKELSNDVAATAAEEILEQINSGEEAGAKTPEVQSETQPEAAPQTIWNQAETGIGWTAGKLAGVATTIGGYMNKIWENIKPHIRKIATMPGLSFILGAENVKKLQEWFGYDPTMLEVKEAVGNRIPADVAFEITDKRELIAFNDRYDEMLRIRNKTPQSYSKGAFVDEMIQKDFLNLDNLPLNANKKKELVMTQIVTAAKKLIEAAKKEEEKREKEKEEKSDSAKSDSSAT